MSTVLHRETTTITIASFWENHLLTKYNYNPDFQRKSIWTEEKQSFLIDSILRNYPIPPIFLHQRINQADGKTTYDVIDGRQRLEAIVKFIKGDIAVSVEQDAGEENPLSGKYFPDLDAPELRDYKMQFWRYSLPIEYIDTVSKSTIDSIFDRLNRNGEPLEGQELRHAKYHDTLLLRTIRDLAEDSFWRPHLDKLSVTRMEDIEFMSEMVFVLTEGGPQESDQHLLDAMYDKYKGEDFPESEVRERFAVVTQFVKSLNLDFDLFKISGPSHLYGLWTYGVEAVKNSVSANVVSPKLTSLFAELRSKKKTENVIVENYRRSMSYNTRSKSQRVRRLQALETAASQ